MKTFFRLISLARPLGRYWPSFFIISILSVIFGIVNFALLAPLQTIIFTPENMGQQLVIPVFSMDPDYFKNLFLYYLTKFMGGSSQLKGLLFVCLMLVITSLLSNLTRYLSQRILVSLRTRLMYNIRKALFHKISRLHIGYFHEKRKGRYSLKHLK